MSAFFDYHRLADEAGVEAASLAKLESCLKAQYGSDQMLFELRMLRTLKSIGEGVATVAEAIEEMGDGKTRNANGKPPLRRSGSASSIWQVRSSGKNEGIPSDL